MITATKRILSLSKTISSTAAIQLVESRKFTYRKFHHGLHWTYRACNQVLKDLEIEVTHSGNIPNQGGIVLPNHISYLDGIVLGSLFPAIFIGKKEVESWPVFGQLMNIAPVLFVERGNRESGKQIKQQIRELVKQDNMVVNFPEGTTSDGKSILPFKRGLFMDVFDKPIVLFPTAITYKAQGCKVEWIGSDTFLDHLWQLAGHKGITAHVHFCSPIVSDEPYCVDDLIGMVRGQIQQQLDKVS